MAIAITGASRLQDLSDVNVTPAVGEDEKVLVYDHDVQQFVLKASAVGVTDHGLLDAPSLLDDDHTQYLLATGGRTGASAGAQPFTVGISLVTTTTATTGVIFKGADRFLHDFHHPTGNTAVPAGQNTFVGVNAGNFTMGSTATNTAHASFNVGVGHSALSANTIGQRNTAVGADALRQNAGGNYNMAFGQSALFTNSSGSSNVAIGYAALYKTTGNSNVAVGGNCLYNATGASNVGVGANVAYGVTTGSNNTFIGHEAGRYHADGTTALTDPENSIYIGYGVRAYDNSDSNSIVIGYTAIGLGANTTVIGNTSTTVATIYGAHLANLTDATTNAIVPMLTLTKNVTGAGVGANGLGPGIVFQAESSTTDSVQQARIGALWNDATHATYKADLVLYASDSGGEREGLRIRGAGAAAAIGFFGHAPSAQPAAYTPSNVSTDRAFDADTVAVAELADVVGTLIADLQSLGLVA